MTSTTRRAPSEHPDHEPRSFPIGLARFFNEGVLGFLALVALATALGPMVFDVSIRVERMLTVVEWMLVASFAAEFVIQGAVANSPRKWVRDPWRIVDALTILGPVVALLPQVSDLASGSLMLRMLRVGRAVAFGTRAGSVAVRQPRGAGPTVRGTTPTVTVVHGEGDLHPAGSDWNSFLNWKRQPAGRWFHALNLDRHRFDELADAAGVLSEEIVRIFKEDGHAMLREGEHHATLALQIPTLSENDFPHVRRDRLLAVVT